MTYTQTYVLLPLSEAAVKEIAEQVTRRDQPERVGSHNGKMTVDLSDVAVVIDPDAMMVGDGK